MKSTFTSTLSGSKDSTKIKNQKLYFLNSSEVFDILFILTWSIIFVLDYADVNKLAFVFSWPGHWNPIASLTFGQAKCVVATTHSTSFSNTKNCHRIKEMSHLWVVIVFLAQKKLLAQAKIQDWKYLTSPKMTSILPFTSPSVKRLLSLRKGEIEGEAVSIFFRIHSFVWTVKLQIMTLLYAEEQQI